MLELPEIAEAESDDFDKIVEAGQPAILRGLVSDWPAVKTAAASPEEFRSYLLQFDNNMAVEAYVAPPEAEGRFFY